ncbi:uncharacterized protein LOC121384682 [Gigantopelta aegis]|uniref:uncharacterized protein LOC121384682 n=1 Tax=Gigantopelta aegis TaxID=1735272 RepID=UPI001B88E310|nr:uncharacterized protein LOC121384682 [Gigantopelta aegis]
MNDHPQGRGRKRKAESNKSATKMNVNDKSENYLTAKRKKKVSCKNEEHNRQEKMKPSFEKKHKKSSTTVIEKRSNSQSDKVNDKEKESVVMELETNILQEDTTVDMSEKYLRDKNESEELNLTAEIASKDSTICKVEDMLRMSHMEDTAEYNPLDNITESIIPVESCEQPDEDVAEIPVILKESTDADVDSGVDTKTKDASKNKVDTSKQTKPVSPNTGLNSILTKHKDHETGCLCHSLNRNLIPDPDDEEKEISMLETDAESDYNMLLCDMEKTIQSLVCPDIDSSSKVEPRSNGQKQIDADCLEMDQMPTVVPDQDENKNTAVHCLETELMSTPVPDHDMEHKITSQQMETKPTPLFISREDDQERKAPQCLEADPSSAIVPYIDEAPKTCSQFLVTDSTSIHIPQRDEEKKTASMCSDSHTSETKANTSRTEQSTTDEESKPNLNTNTIPMAEDMIEEKESSSLCQNIVSLINPKQNVHLEADDLANNETSCDLITRSKPIPLQQSDSGSSLQKDQGPNQELAESEGITRYTKDFENDNGNKEKNTSTDKNTSFDGVSKCSEKVPQMESSVTSVSTVKENLSISGNFSILLEDPCPPYEDRKGVEALQDKSKTNFDSCIIQSEHNLKTNIAELKELRVETDLDLKLKESKNGSNLDLKLNEWKNVSDFDLNLKESKNVSYLDLKLKDSMELPDFDLNLIDSKDASDLDLKLKDPKDASDLDLKLKDSKDASDLDLKLEDCKGASDLDLKLKDCQGASDLDLKLEDTKAVSDLDITLKDSKVVIGDQQNNQSSKLITEICLPVDQVLSSEKSTSCFLDLAKVETVQYTLDDTDLSDSQLCKIDLEESQSCLKSITIRRKQEEEGRKVVQGLIHDMQYLNKLLLKTKREIDTALRKKQQQLPQMWKSNAQNYGQPTRKF